MRKIIQKQLSLSTDDEIKLDLLYTEEEISKAIIKETNDGLKIIEKEVLLLSEITQDLAQLTGYQGEIVEKVEQVTEEAKQCVSEAIVELKKAGKYKSKSRKMKTLLISTGVGAGVGACAGLFGGPVFIITGALLGSLGGAGVGFGIKQFIP